MEPDNPAITNANKGKSPTDINTPAPDIAPTNTKPSAPKFNTPDLSQIIIPRTPKANGVANPGTLESQYIRKSI